MKTQILSSILILTSILLNQSCVDAGDPGQPTASDVQTASPSPSPAPSPSPGVIPVGTVDDTSFSVKTCRGDGPNGPSSSDSCKSFYTIHKTSSLGDECKVSPTATTDAEKFIDCYVEGYEGDLWYWGMKFAYNVPTTMCKYFLVQPYSFRNFQIGNPATSVAYTVELDNSISGFTPTPAGSAVQNSAGSAAFHCKYDYSTDAIPGPNCCKGNYNQVVTTKTMEDQGGVSVLVTRTVSTPQSWTGSFSACMAGPAVETEASNGDGFFTGTIVDVDKAGANRAYTVRSPSLALDISRNSNPSTDVWLANFYKTLPVGLTPTALTFFDTAQPSPYYEFSCLDESFEYLARIRIQVRDWNTTDKLLACLNSVPGSATYNTCALATSTDPDVVGTETTPPGSSKNDIFDWDDWNTTYPQLIR